MTFIPLRDLMSPQQIRHLHLCPSHPPIAFLQTAPLIGGWKNCSELHWHYSSETHNAEGTVSAPHFLFVVIEHGVSSVRQNKNRKMRGLRVCRMQRSIFIFHRVMQRLNSAQLQIYFIFFLNWNHNNSPLKVPAASLSHVISAKSSDHKATGGLLNY